MCEPGESIPCRSGPGNLQITNGVYSAMPTNHRCVRTFLLTLPLAMLAAPAWSQSPAAPAPLTQSLEAMEASGTKMAFDVASVKLDKAANSPHSNFPLGPGDSYSPNGGLFTATGSPLSVYIGFAYRLTPDQTQSLQSHLPKWANEDRFDIQARTTATATKDQMRMMMQSLLADRFKLAIRRDTRRFPCSHWSW